MTTFEIRTVVGLRRGDALVTTSQFTTDETRAKRLIYADRVRGLTPELIIHETETTA